MRSQLFSTVFENPESETARTFERHLKELLALDEKTRERCIAETARLLRPATDFQKRQLVDRVAGSRREDLQPVEHALAVLKFFVTSGLLNDTIPEDDFEDWAEDLATRIQEEEREKLEAVITALVRLRPELQEVDRERRASIGVLPRFKSFGSTVEIRGIVDGRYRWGMDVHEYAPKIIDHTYVISAHIGVDEGFPADFSFQLDAAGLDDLIASLEATRKEVAALRRYIGQNS